MLSNIPGGILYVKSSAPQGGSGAALLPPISGMSPTAAAAALACAAARTRTAAGKKVGRPRMYDTVTPVVAAAEAAAVGEPPKRRKCCRGAKPKYLCQTEQEAVAKRCEISCWRTHFHLAPLRTPNICCARVHGGSGFAHCPSRVNFHARGSVNSMHTCVQA